MPIDQKGVPLIRLYRLPRSHAEFKNIVLALLLPRKNARAREASVIIGRYSVARPDRVKPLFYSVLHANWRVARHTHDQHNPRARLQAGVELGLIPFPLPIPNRP
jgi:hypothetical protein